MIIGSSDVNTPYNPLLPTQQHLISYKILQDWRIQREGSLTIPVSTIFLDHPKSWLLFYALCSSSPHRYWIGLRCGDWDGHVRACFGLLYCWKTQRQRIFSFLAVAIRSELIILTSTVYRFFKSLELQVRFFNIFRFKIFGQFLPKVSIIVEVGVFLILFSAVV